MFEGVRGVNIAGDIAIDDISLSDGLCSGMLCFLNCIEGLASLIIGHVEIVWLLYTLFTSVFFL